MSGITTTNRPSRLVRFLQNWAKPRHPCARLLARDLAEAPDYLRGDMGLDGGVRMHAAPDTHWPMNA